MAIMERIMRIGFALSLVVSMTGALQVTIPKTEYEFARGDNITLPCKFVPKNPTNPLVVISWTREGDKPGAPESQILTYYSTSKTLDIKEKYTGRVTLDHNIATGKADLKLSSITLAENRVFECRVSIPRDDEGKPAATTRLIVLVAPSKPICKIEGSAEYGQNINLTCLSEEGSPKPEYKWDTRDVRNTPRPPDPRTTDKGGILSLFNLTKETSGFYICTSSNKIRSATCNVTVAVMPPSMNIGSTAGIIGGAVAAVIVLIIVIYCCCCRKKEKEEDFAMGVREEGEYRDKEQPENGERPSVDRLESVRSDDESSVRNASNRQEERSEREYDRRSDYDDRRSDYDDRRSDYSDRRDKYDRDDRRDDRRRDDDRRYDDERRDEDRRYDDDDRRDRSYKDDRYDEPYEEDDRRPPKVPSKPSRVEYDD